MFMFSFYHEGTKSRRYKPNRQDTKLMAELQPVARVGNPRYDALCCTSHKRTTPFISL
jgi:hypothetical protein